MNLASMAGQAIMVLFAQEQLGLGSVGYGLLLAGHGGVLGSLAATRLGRHAGTATLLLAAVLVLAALMALPAVSNRTVAAARAAVES